MPNVQKEILVLFLFFCFFGWAGSGGLNTFTRFPNLVIALIHRCPHTPRLETQQ